MPDVRLSVGGAEYGGWKEIRIHRGIEQIAGSFELAVSERWPGRDVPRPIRPGDHCAVTVDGATVITGYVDDVSPSYDAERHELRVTGRDKAGALVDCSAIHSPGEWRNISLTKLVETLCQPFGIGVHAAVDVGKRFSSFSIQESETAFETLERAARMRGVLLISDGNGGLILGRAGSDKASVRLARGENILAASGQFSHRDRFSQYLIKGQRKGTDDDAETPETITEVLATAKDVGVGRYRPLLIIAEELGDRVTYQTRAAWERNIRLGRSIRTTITMQGWRELGGTGALWAPNRRVQVVDDWQGLDAELLIAGVTLSLGERGTLTELELTHPAAFDLLPEADHQKKTQKQDSGLGWL